MKRQLIALALFTSPIYAADSLIVIVQGGEAGDIHISGDSPVGQLSVRLVTNDREHVIVTSDHDVACILHVAESGAAVLLEIKSSTGSAHASILSQYQDAGTGTLSVRNINASINGNIMAITEAWKSLNETDSRFITKKRTKEFEHIPPDGRGAAPRR